MIEPETVSQEAPQGSGSDRDWFRVNVGYRLRTNLGLVVRYSYTYTTLIVQGDSDGKVSRFTDSDGKFSELMVQLALPHAIRRTDNVTVYSVTGPYGSQESAAAGGPPEDTPTQQRRRLEAAANEKRWRPKRELISQAANKERTDRQRRELEAAEKEGTAYVVTWVQRGVRQKKAFMDEKMASRFAHDIAAKPYTTVLQTSRPDLDHKPSEDETLSTQIGAAPESKCLLEFYGFRHVALQLVNDLNEILSALGVSAVSPTLGDLPERLEVLSPAIQNDARAMKLCRQLDVVLMMMTKAQKDALTKATDYGFVRTCWRLLRNNQSVDELDPDQVQELRLVANLVLQASPKSAQISALFRRLGDLSPEEEGILQQRLFDENPLTEVHEVKVPHPGSFPESERPKGDPAPDFRTCPDCAEEVRFAARKCRFCGFHFTQAEA